MVKPANKRKQTAQTRNLSIFLREHQSLQVIIDFFLILDPCDSG